MSRQVETLIKTQNENQTLLTKTNFLIRESTIRTHFHRYLGDIIDFIVLDTFESSLAIVAQLKNHRVSRGVADLFRRNVRLF